MSRPRVMLTGASGMVGRNLLAHPAAAEFDFFTPTSRELDLRDYAATRDYVRATQPDLILHAAARSQGIQAIALDPVRSYVENVDVGRNIVIAARESGVQKLINIASSTVYPIDAPNPLTEDSVLGGPFEPNVEPYALAKVSILRLCQYVAREDPSCQFKTLVPCNLYGPYAKFGPTEAVLIPAVIHRLHQARIRSESSVPIWGDGTARREFMFVGDFADCLIEAIRRFDMLPDLMNVGVGADRSVEDYYRLIADLVGFNGEFIPDLSRPVGARQKLLDVTCLAAWGWHARTSLSEGLRATYDYFLERVAGSAESADLLPDTGRTPAAGLRSSAGTGN